MSYLLINFWFTRLEANKAAMLALLMNRVGDWTFSMGIYIIALSLGTLDFASLFPVTYAIDQNLITLICILLFIGAMAKSAQLGLNTWLPQAMEGPTPVSALLHAATCAFSSLKILSKANINFYTVESTPSTFLSNNIYKKYKLIENKAILIWDNEKNNNFRLTKGLINKKERDNFKLTKYHKSIIIGLILSDGHIRKEKHYNSRISLKQSIKNFEYLWDVFYKLSIYCGSYPHLNKNIKRKKLFFNLQFQTRRLKALNEIYNLFFSNNFKLKSITVELYNYIDYIAIAHWIMGDGAKRNKGIILCTDCFTIKEVVLLINILLIKYNINSTIHYDNNKPRIYINKKELNKIIPYIKPYFVKSFLYKLHY